MRKKGVLAVVLCCVLLTLGFAFFGSLSADMELEEEVSQDTNMDTVRFQTHVAVGEDQSYLVQETIEVDMLTSRHGIYRYVPVKGTVYSQERKKNLPYKAKVELLSCSQTVSTEYSDGFFVMRLGEEDRTVRGEQTYELEYRLTPMFQGKDGGYDSAYINVFPTSWQNALPAGSSFSVTFPKDIDKKDLHFYYGRYGSSRDAQEILRMEWDGRQVKGTLLEELPLGEGVTVYGEVGEGYFSRSHRIPPVGLILGAVSLLVLGITGGCFVFLGRDEKLISSVQFQPPVDLDSAAVGYVIDGAVDDKDIISLILYWADRGHLVIQEDKKQKITLIKTGLPLPQDAPGYEKTFYERLFRKGDKVQIKDLKYRCAKTIESAKAQVADYVGARGGLYTISSRVARVVCTILSVVPLLLFLILHMEYNKLSVGTIILGWVQLLLLVVGMLLFEDGVDRWHGSSQGRRTAVTVSGAGLVLAGILGLLQNYWRLYQAGRVFDLLLPLFLGGGVTLLCVTMCAFMKKRTPVCVDWMGRLLGLREFIETAELDRLKAMAEENPQWFYHVLPYTYVFGLSDVFAKRLEPLAIPAPEWYVGAAPDYHTWNYYHFSRAMSRSMSAMTTTLTMVDVSAGTGKAGGSSFSGGGGGFSGGGFGGGGGGSW